MTYRLLIGYYHGMHDFRFEITALDEPEIGCTDLVRMIELVIAPPDAQWPCETVVDGDVIESFTTDDPYGAVEAAREAQAMSFEERFEPFGLRWQQEQRQGCWA